TDPHPEAAAVLSLQQFHRRPVKACNLLDDRQAKARPRIIGADAAVEPPQDGITPVRRDTRPVIFHFEYGATPFTGHANGHFRAPAGIEKPVCDEVLEEFAEKQRLGRDAAGAVSLEAEIYPGLRSHRYVI